jgi:hypothetical protein
VMPDAEIYAKMHRQFLEKHHPKTFKQLKDNGQLVEHPEEGGPVGARTLRDHRGADGE